MITADNFTALVHSLGLASGFFKPVPTSASSDEAGISAINQTVSGILPVPLDPLASDQGGQVNISSKKAQCNVDPYNAPSFDVTFAPFDPIRANVYRYRQQYSVNLGSWYSLTSSPRCVLNFHQVRARKMDDAFSLGLCCQ